ncbi:MAG: RDD family protein [Deltaproteobacteria bacterium]|nr:RDD family protein [Deltaproteobacteria bacterium]
MMVHYGGFWRRFVAISIDSIILDLLALILFLIGNRIAPADDTFGYAAIIPYFGMALLLNAAYFTYFHGTTGQTPGKKLLGLRVVQVNGGALTAGTAFLRWVGYIISKIPLYLGFIWAAFDGRKQGWHDKLAGTCVIRTAVYRRAADQVSPGAPFGTDRGRAPAGGDFPYGDGTPEENTLRSENT